MDDLSEKLDGTQHQCPEIVTRSLKVILVESSFLEARGSPQIQEVRRHFSFSAGEETLLSSCTIMEEFLFWGELFEEMVLAEHKDLKNGDTVSLQRQKTKHVSSLINRFDLVLFTQK